MTSVARSSRENGLHEAFGDRHPCGSGSESRALDGEVILHGDTYDEACDHALQLAEERGMVASGRAARGEVYSVLADLMDQVGLEAFFARQGA